MKFLYENVTIVIPVSSSVPEAFEKISLSRCLQVLHKYPIVFVVPAQMDVSWYKENCAGETNISFERFDNQYFGSTERHSRLLLSALFYKRFLSYEYILIHHLDVFVFEDSLLEWCKKNYYYIGGPWLQTNWHKNLYQSIANETLSSKPLINRMLLKIIWKLSGLDDNAKLAVGNGGLSLRKVKPFYQACITYKKMLNTWRYNEDIFWSIYLPLNLPCLKLPGWKKALEFSFDINPSVCFKYNNKNLPFGCHAWFKDELPYTGNLEFWAPIIEMKTGFKIEDKIRESGKPAK